VGSDVLTGFFAAGRGGREARRAAGERDVGGIGLGAGQPRQQLGKSVHRDAGEDRGGVPGAIDQLGVAERLAGLEQREVNLGIERVLRQRGPVCAARLRPLPAAQVDASEVDLVEA
jgi:hypothetical protein